jgi:hypothetical protein
MVRVMKSALFGPGLKAQICVKTAIYAGSKEPAPPTEVGGLPPAELKAIYEIASSKHLLHRCGTQCGIALARSS